MKKEVICGRCMGHGKIEHYTSFWEDDDLEPTECPMCHGTGKNYIVLNHRQALFNSPNEELAKRLIKTEISCSSSFVQIDYVCSDYTIYTYQSNLPQKGSDLLRKKQKYNLAIMHEVEWLKSPSE